MINSGKIESEIEDIVQSLLPYKPKKVILFGSAARGDFHEGSDLDLVVIKDTPLRFVERISDVMGYLDTKFPIDVVVYTEEEFTRMKREGNPFIHNILHEGRVIYG